MLHFLMGWFGWLEKSGGDDGGPGAEQSTVWDALGHGMDPDG
jgi:hypothetical protein